MTDNVFERLAAPFPPERIHWRVGATNKDKTKGMALAYIDARDVMERLDEVMTPAGWASTFPHADGKTICTLTLKIGDEWISKSDGAGDTDVEGEKGAISSALKRAGVQWGIGRYLYAISSPWVALDDYKRIVDAEYRKLEDLLARHTDEIEWGSPGEKAMARALYQSIRTTVLTADAVRLYREQNGGVLANLRKAPREQMEALLDQIADGSVAVMDKPKARKAA